MVRQAQEVVPGKIALLAGGFHEQPVSESELAQLRLLDVQGVMPTHCTGPAAMDLLRTGFGNNYRDGGVGRTATLSTK
jgi:7,8-dihydropterin-6-yl-methyl-4-(beta-D-ribofuranosyl)aminobenzene 5'-phosphate synthase